MAEEHRPIEVEAGAAEGAFAAGREVAEVEPRIAFDDRVGPVRGDDAAARIDEATPI